MSIKITNPFSFNSNKPNFDRDIINSELFESKYPFILTDEERHNLGKSYDIGHIVWDTYTKKEYRVLNTEVNGESYYCLGYQTIQINQNNTELDVNNGILTLSNNNIIGDLINVIYCPLTTQPSNWDEYYSQYLIVLEDGNGGKKFGLNTDSSFVIDKYYEPINYNTGNSLIVPSSSTSNVYSYINHIGVISGQWNIDELDTTNARTYAIWELSPDTNNLNIFNLNAPLNFEHYLLIRNGFGDNLEIAIALDGDFANADIYADIDTSNSIEIPQDSAIEICYFASLDKTGKKYVTITKSAPLSNSPQLY